MRLILCDRCSNYYILQVKFQIFQHKKLYFPPCVFYRFIAFSSFVRQMLGKFPYDFVDRSNIACSPSVYICAPHASKCAMALIHVFAHINTA